jgi:hypothetical protein
VNPRKTPHSQAASPSFPPFLFLFGFTTKRLYLALSLSFFWIFEIGSGYVAQAGAELKVLLSSQVLGSQACPPCPALPCWHLSSFTGQAHLRCAKCLSSLFAGFTLLFPICTTGQTPGAGSLWSGHAGCPLGTSAAPHSHPGHPNIPQLDLLYACEDLSSLGGSAHPNR